MIKHLRGKKIFCGILIFLHILLIIWVFSIDVITYGAFTPWVEYTVEYLRTNPFAYLYRIWGAYLLFNTVFLIYNLVKKKHFPYVVLIFALTAFSAMLEFCSVLYLGFASLYFVDP